MVPLLSLSYCLNLAKNLPWSDFVKLWEGRGWSQTRKDGSAGILSQKSIRNYCWIRGRLDWKNRWKNNKEEQEKHQKRSLPQSIDHDLHFFVRNRNLVSHRHSCFVFLFVVSVVICRDRKGGCDGLPFEQMSGQLTTR